VVAALTFGSTAEGSSTARFDVIFDDARGLVAGQLVKIAGAKAGTIEDVVVTPDFKARIEASVDSRFMPFHTDATCTIRPEGLIAENYVDCDPGSANSPVLPASGGHPPTVPVQNTTEPVSLLDLFNMFNLPTRQRFMVIIDELGIGTAGRGQDFNYVLRRANPALSLAHQAIGILARQRAQLATIVDATNTIAAEAARHTTAVQSFLDRAAAVSTVTAQHRDNLSLAIQRLPGLLAATQPALQQLDTVAVNGTPLLQQIHAAVPALNQVSTDFGPFVTAASPALAELGGTLARAIPAIRDLTPVVSTIRAYTAASLPGTKLLGRLFSNLQQHGFIENFLSSFYYVTASVARFDSISHIAPDYVVDVANGACSNYASTPVPGCSAHYGSNPAYKPSRSLANRATAAGGRASTPAPPQRQQLAKALIGKALGGTPAPSAGQLQGLQRILRDAASGPAAASTQNLLNYLLK
jgi:phospholipid/cholesterol/gamma-HCH transport system substrate-binding protein